MTTILLTGTIFLFSSFIDGGERVIDKTGEKGIVKITVNTPGENMQDMEYDVDVIKINAGQKVKLTLKNPAESKAMQHNFVVVPEGKGQEVANAALKAGMEKDFIPVSHPEVKAYSPKLTGPGDKTTFTFSIDKAGEYKFICTYPGHYPNMQGRLVVQ